MVVSDNTLNFSGRRRLIMYRESRPLLLYYQKLIPGTFGLEISPLICILAMSSTPFSRSEGHSTMLWLHAVESECQNQGSRQLEPSHVRNNVDILPPRADIDNPS